MKTDDAGKKARAATEIVADLLTQPALDDDIVSHDDAVALFAAAKAAAKGAPVYQLRIEGATYLFRPLTMPEFIATGDPDIPDEDAEADAMITAALLYPSWERVQEECRVRPLLRDTLADEILRITGGGSSYRLERVR